MKRGLIVILLILNIVVMIMYFNVNSDYIKLSNNLIDMLDGTSYDDKIDESEIEYKKIVNDISLLSGNELDKEMKVDGIIMELDNEYELLVSENDELSNKKDNLGKQKKNLENTYNEIVAEQIKKSTFIIDGVPKINQYSLGYPTGCESAALTVLLKYHGVSVSMGDVVKALPKGDLPYYDNGVRYGGNPYVEFVGTPSSYNSYGVYEKPILQVAESFKSGVINGTGKKLDEIFKIVSEGRPVLVWVSMNMAVPYISTSWIYRPTGEEIGWMANEHALVVVGYNQNQVIVSDSLTGSLRYYDRGVFENRYNTYGKRAVYY